MMNWLYLHQNTDIIYNLIYLWEKLLILQYKERDRKKISLKTTFDAIYLEIKEDIEYL